MTNISSDDQTFVSSDISDFITDILDCVAFKITSYDVKLSDCCHDFLLTSALWLSSCG